MGAENIFDCSEIFILLANVTEENLATMPPPTPQPLPRPLSSCGVKKAGTKENSKVDCWYCRVVKLTHFIGSLHLFLRWLRRGGFNCTWFGLWVQQAGISDCGGWKEGVAVDGVAVAFRVKCLHSYIAFCSRLSPFPWHALKTAGFGWKQEELRTFMTM